MLEMLTRALIFQWSDLIQFQVILSSFNNRAREFERSHLQKFKTQGRGGGGMLKFRVDRRVIGDTVI